MVVEKNGHKKKSKAGGKKPNKDQGAKDKTIAKSDDREDEIDKINKEIEKIGKMSFKQPKVKIAKEKKEKEVETPQN